MKREKLSRTLCALAALGLMCFIYRNSALVAEDSAAESGLLLEWLTRTLGISPTSFLLRKGAHMAEFAALGFFLLPAVGEDLLPRLKKRWVPAWLIAALYGVSDEVHQLFVPGRSCELRDMLIDAAGAALGIALARLVFSPARRKDPPR